VNAKWGQCSAATILSRAPKLCCARSESNLPSILVDKNSRAFVRFMMGPVVTAFLFESLARAS
jgi:hypothetical protein